MRIWSEFSKLTIVSPVSTLTKNRFLTLIVLTLHGFTVFKFFTPAPLHPDPLCVCRCEKVTTVLTRSPRPSPRGEADDVGLSMKMTRQIQLKLNRRSSPPTTTFSVPAIMPKVTVGRKRSRYIMLYQIEISSYFKFSKRDLLELQAPTDIKTTTKQNGLF